MALETVSFPLKNGEIPWLRQCTRGYACFYPSVRRYSLAAMVLRCDEERVAARAEPMVKCEVSTLEYSHDFIGNVGIAMINHPFVMVYTTHLW